MKPFYILKKNNLKIVTLSILFSFHLFFWDIKIINNYGLREGIAIVNFYLLYDLIKNNFFTLKKNIKSIFYICLVILCFSLHLFINTKYDEISLHIQSLQGLIGFSSLLFIIFFYYDFIKSNLGNFINLFLFIFLLSAFFSEFSESSWGDIKTLCASYFKISNKLIFQENSHLAMVFTPCIGYLFIKNKDKSFLFHSILLAILVIISYLQTSATYYVSLIILFFLISILEFNFFIKKFIFLTLMFVLIILIVTFIDNIYKKNHIDNKYKSDRDCTRKISESTTGIQKFVVDKLNFPKKEDDTFIINKKKLHSIINSKTTQEELLKSQKKKYTILPKEKINKNIAYPDLPRNYPNITFNLSTAVLLNALNISFETLKNRPLGWGLNRYEYAFDYYMFNNIVKPYWYHEVYTLNFNDGSANIPKLITEFGYVSFILIPIMILFLFNRKINNELKVFFLILILTQLVRGAGFFNGGFIFSLIFMTFTVFKFFKKNG